MPIRTDMKPQEYLEVFRRRKWLIIFSVLFVMFGATVYCVVVPNKYVSKTTILVIPQRVPEKFVKSTVTYGVEERLAATSQKIMSRTNLIAIIDELGLYREERNTISQESLASKMRKNIEINIIKGKDAFELSFEHEIPQIAMLTVSKLASFFIDENLRVREQLAVGTSEFLETQLQEVKTRLEQQEEKVKQYKLAYMGELPQEMQANLNMLTRLQDQKRTNAEAIAKAEDRKVFLQSQVTALQNQIRTLEGGVEDPTDLLIDELYNKQKQLEELSAKYTPNYPTIIQLRREIEQLETMIASNDPGSAEIDNTATTGFTLRKRKASREKAEVTRLNRQITSLDLEIQALRREQLDIQRSSDSIQAKVARLPQREQEMISLTRDYDNLKKSYDDLLKKKLEAEVSQNLEQRQKAEQFQILDPANLPRTPFKPDRPKVLGLAFLGALALGFGGAMGLEFIDPKLRGTADFKHFFDLPVLATIPIIQDAQYARRKKLRRAAVLGGILSFMCAVIAFVLLYGDRIRSLIQF
jgi:polysaccharide chain length determinant protein (PEP-CTERM system associated)